MSASQAFPGGGGRRQKRMGPAPFASFEDLSDEVRPRLESPSEDKVASGSVVRLPGIREDATPVSPMERISGGISLVGAAVSPQSTLAKSSISSVRTPRIDISRASSSSYSREDTLEHYASHDPTNAKLGSGFREDGAQDLRSSTEELDFQEQKKGTSNARAPSPQLHDDSYQHSHQRKDSQSSEIGLLSISGRTSRLSSIGSQGSGQSRLSNASHLSVLSGQSGISRSPSPHKMLLETSFCGAKPPANSRAGNDQPGTKIEAEVMEKVLLSRKHDPTEVILAEGVPTISRKDSHGSLKLPPEKPARRIERRVQSVKNEVTKFDKDDSNNTPKLPRRIVAESGVEYIYIPLRGPLPKDTESSDTGVKTKAKPSVSVSSSSAVSMSSHKPPKSPKSPKTPESKHSSKTKPEAGKSKPTQETTNNRTSQHPPEPKYIRIKLKPDYMYSDEDKTVPVEMQKPESLDLCSDLEKRSQIRAEIEQQEEIRHSDPVSSSTTTTEYGKSLTSTPSPSPKLSKKAIIKETSSKTPSPSLSRKSSFASLFRSKELIVSPDSPTPSSTRRKKSSGMFKEARDRSRSRSRSKSRDRTSNLSAAPSSTESIDGKSSKKSSVFSLFKSKKGDKCKSDTASAEALPNLDGGLTKVEFKFNEARKGEPEYIFIPLHSPNQSEDRSILQELKTSSQDSQETVIEAVTRNVDVVVESVPKNTEINLPVQSSKTDLGGRQSSTSSENVVFSTKLGSDNEVFVTKLPKKLKTKETETEHNIESEKLDEDKKEFQDTISDKEINTPPKGKEIDDELVEKNTKMQEDKESKEVPEPSQKPRVISEERRKSVEKLRKVGSGKAIDLSDTDFATFESVAELKPETEIQKPTEIKNSAEIQKPTKTKSNRNSAEFSLKDDEKEDRHSSESERDSEVESSRTRKDLNLKLDLDFEPERKGLVLQQDSYEDELPYIPTTLPLERSAAVPIIPVKQRSTFEMKTCPIERPRSTTPINPSCLEEYCEEVLGNFNTEVITKQIEKLKISLPRHDSSEKIKSPRKMSTTTNWSEFAEKGISTVRRSSTQQDPETPPPLPPKGVQKEWINFEEIPEKRKPPKRIQTIPSRGHIDVPEMQENVVYNYVNPEECKCECHELSAREKEKRSETLTEPVPVSEDELPLLEDDTCEDEKSVGAEAMEKTKLEVAHDRRSVRSDSSVDLSMSVEQPPLQSDVNAMLRTPFTSDLGLSSNRSSIVSQEEPQSPDSESPNAFPNK